MSIGNTTMEEGGTSGCSAATIVAQQRLRTSAYRPLRDVQCDEREDTVVLRGRVSSYFYKQLAQETVRKADHACRIVNELEVEDRSR